MHTYTCMYHAHTDTHTNPKPHTYTHPHNMHTHTMHTYIYIKFILKLKSPQHCTYTLTKQNTLSPWRMEFKLCYLPLKVFPNLFTAQAISSHHIVYTAPGLRSRLPSTLSCLCRHHTSAQDASPPCFWEQSFFLSWNYTHWSSNWDCPSWKITKTL